MDNFRDCKKMYKSIYLCHHWRTSYDRLLNVDVNCLPDKCHDKDADTKVKPSAYKTLEVSLFAQQRLSQAVNRDRPHWPISRCGFNRWTKNSLLVSTTRYIQTQVSVSTRIEALMYWLHSYSNEFF